MGNNTTEPSHCVILLLYVILVKKGKYMDNILFHFKLKWYQFLQTESVHIVIDKNKEFCVAPESTVEFNLGIGTHEISTEYLVRGSVFGAANKKFAVRPNKEYLLTYTLSSTWDADISILET